METDPNIGMIATAGMSDFLDIMELWDMLFLDEAELLVTVGIHTEPVKETYLKVIEDARAKGVTMAHKLPALRRTLLIEVPKSFRTADEFGLSAVSSMVFKRRNRIPDWKIYELGASVLVANFHEGQFCWIAGPPRQGKTGMAVTMMLLAVDRELAVFSNIKLKDDRFVHVTNLRELLREVLALPTSKRWVFFWDDAGGSYAKSDASTTSSKDTDRLAKILIGKLHGNLVLVEQRPEAVPSTVQAFVTTRIFCHSPGTITMVLEGPSVWMNTKVQGLPKPKAEFDTYDIGYFDINLNVKKLLESLSDSTDRRQSLRTFLGEK